MIKNRVLYFMLFFLSLSFIYFYGGKMPYMLFYVVIVLPVISIVFTLIAYSRFRFVESIDKRIVVKGDTVNFILCIHNPDFFLYPFIKVNFYGEDTIFARQFQAKNFSLLPFKKKSFTFNLTCKYRGYYMVGIKTIELEDYLGIFRLSYSPCTTKTITVNPRLITLDNFQIKTNYLSEAHSILNNRYEDITTISDTRKYAYGDSLKKIHWKLSAKVNQLMVKNYEGTSKTNCVIMLDLKKNKYSYDQNIMLEDKLIECAVAVVNYCLCNWIPINLIYHSKGFNDIAAKNSMDFDKIYDLLSNVSFDHDIELKDLLNIYSRDNAKKIDLLIFTANIDYGLYDEIYNAKAIGYDVNLIYVYSESFIGISENIVKDILMDLPEIGVTTYKIDLEDDVRMIFNTSYNRKCEVP